MSEYTSGGSFQDDFEKVDPEQDGDVPDQDEIVTSTSMSGEIPEEDRYEGSPDENEEDIYRDYAYGGGIDSNSSEAVNAGEPLINFDSPVSNVPEPTFTESPPLVTVTESTHKSTKSETVAMPSEGGYLKNVDPRDEVISSSAKDIEPSLEEMDETSQAVSAESVSQSDSGRGPFNGVLELMYWRDVKKTGVVFGSMMFVLLSLSLFSLLSVLAYLSLAILTVTFSFRVYKNVMQAVQKTNEGHPFKKLLEMDIELREDVVLSAAERIACNINCCSRELRRMYLVGDYIDSLKFALLLWLLTYVGAWFNGMTLVILAVVSIFTLPKVYETYQGPIDQNVNLIRAQLNKIMAQVSAKIPFPKKKVKAQ